MIFRFAIVVIKVRVLTEVITSGLRPIVGLILMFSVFTLMRDGSAEAKIGR